MYDACTTNEQSLPPAAALVHLLGGYRTTQTLFVAAKLGLADLLQAGPRSSEELARLTGTDAPALHRLMRALAALGVFEEIAPGLFGLAALGVYLRADAPDSLHGLVLMHGSEDFQLTWGELLHCVRTGESAVSHRYGAANTFDYYAQNPGVAATVTAGMLVLARMSAVVSAEYDFPPSGTLVDIGGGHGQLLATILNAHPGLRGVLFDLPHLTPEASRLLESAGVLPRCRVVGGDFFQAVPAGGDIYFLSRVIHLWEDERAVEILANCGRAMADGAKLLIVERVLPPLADDSAVSREQLLSDLTMLVRTGGRERTAEEYDRLLTAAGFRLTRVIPTSSPLLISLVEAVRA